MQSVTEKSTIDAGQNEPPFKECQAEIKTKDITKSKFYQMRAEEPFFQAIAPYINSFVKADIFDTALVYSPKNSALENICGHYLTKYGIQIEVIESTLFPSLWSKLKRDKPLFMGIILRHPDKHYGHVCPILCHFSQDHEECYILDVIKAKFKFRLFDEPVDDYLKSKGISVYKAKTERQADMNSCRIGAVTLLRNALLWIKKNQPENLKAILEELKVDRTEFHLPLEWSYTEQIYPKDAGLAQMYVIRDFYSKKQKEPRTIQQFREEHTKEGKFDCCLYLPSIAKIPSSVPPDITVSKREVSYFVSMPVNRYLQEKGVFEMKRAEQLNE